MHIHPGRGDKKTIRFDRPFGAAEVLTNGRDTPLGNRYISGERGFPRPVYNLSTTNQYVMHELSSFLSYVYGNLIVLRYNPFYIVAVNYTGLTKLLHGGRDLS